MTERMDTIPHNTHPQEKKPDAIPEQQNYQPDKSPKQCDTEVSSEPNQREGRGNLSRRTVRVRQKRSTVEHVFSIRLLI